MIFNIETRSSVNPESDVDFIFTIETVCPGCNKGMNPDIIYTYISNFNSGYCLYHCPACSECFLNNYDLENDISLIDFEDGSPVSESKGRLLSTHPKTLIRVSFEEHIEKVSPDFVKIFNQANTAEQLNMLDIAGIAYRKSLEFLVKDYLIFNQPNLKERISSLPLGECIKVHISNKRLQTLAKASTWIGNDEAHYVRKHVDKDIESLKKYIQAFASYLSMELTFIEAEELINR